MGMMTMGKVEDEANGQQPEPAVMRREQLESFIDDLSVDDEILLLRILVNDRLQPNQIAGAIKQEMLSHEVRAVAMELYQ